MATPVSRKLDDHEVFLTETLQSWPAAQRVALVAALGERWLPTYEAFSAAEDWGDPAHLRRCLDAVWGHVEGRRLGPGDIDRLAGPLHDITPHMDDFDDAEGALIACVVVVDALRACRDDSQSLPYVASAAMGIFEGLDIEEVMDPASLAPAWRRGAIRKELKAQSMLVDAIASIATLDADAIRDLRGRIPRVESKTRPRARDATPPGIANQTAFEQYRRMVESDLRGHARDRSEPDMRSYVFILTYLGYWMGRYSRRLQTINGTYGRLADELGQRAVIERNRHRDLATPGQPTWDVETRELLERCLATNCQLEVLDAPSIGAPHGYGPSMRRLWLDGRRRSGSDLDAWRWILAWAEHRPAAWEREDRRKKRGRVHAQTELDANLAREIVWSASKEDPTHPWTAEVDGQAWRVRVNDFPDELMYGLVIGDTPVGDFHDWPVAWRR